MTKLGKFVFTLVVLALAAFGVYRWLNNPATTSPATGNPAGETADEPREEEVPSFRYIVPGPAPKLGAAQPFRMNGDTVVLNLSEYAGYAGIILANNGLEPNEQSWFTRNGGFKLKITLSEEDSWDDLQQGRIAGTATTADVLANYGRQWQTTVPMQIAWSRGATGIIVKSEIRRINDLKGRLVTTAPFTEAEFFIRYLAQEAGLPVERLDGIDSPPNAGAINLVFLGDAFEAGDAFGADLESGAGKLAACVTWAPKTTEIVEGSGGKAHQLIDNRNLLIVADILLFNKAFATENPAIVQKLVEGTLLKNEEIRANPDTHAAALAQAFSAYEWSEADAKEELARVHLSNLPENLSFFRGSIAEAGSFASVYQSANLAYGSELLPRPVDSSFFADLTALEAIAAGGQFAGQIASIEPVKTSQQEPLENDPLLTRDIRFFFLPNDFRLDMANPENARLLGDVNRLLGVSPGSVVLLRGHVDDARRQEFLNQGGETLVRSLALKAIELSTQRAGEVKNQLLSAFPSLDPSRVETVGRGWEEPAGTDSELNRRVEVQWFTLE
jgi:NitT/TauT family transport system substrate-binding protein